jgi:hypothetical protein
MNYVLQVEFLEFIMININTVLEKYYTSKNIIIWQSFDWLSGVHIFTESHTSDDFNEIKEHNVTFDNGPVPIIELYNQILPWNLNSETLVHFKTSIEGKFLKSFLQYVWRQADIIDFYFKTIRITDVDENVFQQLKISTKWYKSGTTILYRFNEAFAVPETFTSLITALENISVDTIGQFSKILSDIQFEYDENWIRNVLSKNINFELAMNNIFLNNCLDAVNYINNYISIINKSKVIQNNLDTYNDEELCKNDNLDRVFTANKSIVGASSSYT